MKYKTSNFYPGMWGGVLQATKQTELNGFCIGDKLVAKPEYEKNIHIMTAVETEIVGFTAGGNGILKLANGQHTLMSPQALDRFYTKLV